MRALQALPLLLLMITIMATPISGEELGQRSVLPPLVKVYDMTWEVRNGIPVFFDIFNGFENVATIEDDGYYMNRLEMVEHTSTHMDSPCHFVEGAWCVDEVPIDRLYGVAVVMDLSKYVSDPNDTITLDEIILWERLNNFEIPLGSIVIVYTGWSDYWGLYDSWVDYMDATGGGFPGFSEEVADYFIEKGVIGVGIDTLSIDPAPSSDFIFHKKLLSKNIWALENVKIPRDLLDRVVFLSIAPMKIDMGSGAPTRVYAFALDTGLLIGGGYEIVPLSPSGSGRVNTLFIEYMFASELKRVFDGATIYDLSWEVRNGIPLFFNIFDGFSNLATIKDLGYYINRLSMVEHTSTHMDSPCHFVEGRWCVDDVPIDRLMGRAVVMDMSWAISNPNDTMSAEEILQWERESNIRLTPGDIILVYTGWGDYWGLYDSWEDYMDATGGGFPGFSEDAAQVFVSRGVYGVGIDTLSIDPAPSIIFPFHKRLLDRNIYGLENVALTSESAVLNSTGIVIVYPFKIGDGSGATSRIFLFKGLDLWSAVDRFTTSLNWVMSVLEGLGEVSNLFDRVLQIEGALTDLDDEVGRIGELEDTLSSLEDSVESLSREVESISTIREDLDNVLGQLSNISIQVSLALAISIIALTTIAGLAFIMRRQL